MSELDTAQGPKNQLETPPKIQSKATWTLPGGDRTFSPFRSPAISTEKSLTFRFALILTFRSSCERPEATDHRVTDVPAPSRMAGAETRPLRVKLRSGRGRGVLLLVPRSCELVADLQQHVQMRLEEEKIVTWLEENMLKEDMLFLLLVGIMAM